MIKGIDVSEHQGEIDWKSVKKSGIVKFAILRAGYGKVPSQIDKQFKNNFFGCCQNAIPYAVYWYSYATNEQEAKEEAKASLEVIGECPITLPYVAYDVEEKRIFESGNSVKICHAFFDEVAKKRSEKLCIYSFKNAFETYLNDKSLDKYGIFLAHITEKTDFKKNWDIWQYSWTGRIPGISEDVDLDYLKEDFLPVLRKKEGTPFVLEVGGRKYSGSIDNE